MIGDSFALHVPARAHTCVRAARSRMMWRPHGSSAIQTDALALARARRTGPHGLARLPAESAASAAPSDGLPAAAVATDGPTLVVRRQHQGGPRHDQAGEEGDSPGRRHGGHRLRADRRHRRPLRRTRTSRRRSARCAGCESAGATRTAPLHRPQATTDDRGRADARPPSRLRTASAGRAGAGRTRWSRSSGTCPPSRRDKAHEESTRAARRSRSPSSTPASTTRTRTSRRTSPPRSPRTAWAASRTRRTAPGARRPRESHHGTHVAGEIAAARNGIGVTGVAPGVKVAGIKVADPDAAFFYTEAVVCAFVFAADHGVEVTNNSYYTDPWLLQLHRTTPTRGALVDAVTRASPVRGAARARSTSPRRATATTTSPPTRSTDPTSPNDTTPVHPHGRPAQVLRHPDPAAGRRHGLRDRRQGPQVVLLQLRSGRHRCRRPGRRLDVPDARTAGHERPDPVDAAGRRVRLHGRYVDGLPACRGRGRADQVDAPARLGGRREGAADARGGRHRVPATRTTSTATARSTPSARAPRTATASTAPVSWTRWTRSAGKSRGTWVSEAGPGTTVPGPCPVALRGTSAIVRSWHDTVIDARSSGYGAGLGRPRRRSGASGPYRRRRTGRAAARAAARHGAGPFHASRSARWPPPNWPRAARTGGPVPAGPGRRRCGGHRVPQRAPSADRRTRADNFAPLSRFWRTADGWVRTHANYPHHRARLLAALGLPPTPERTRWPRVLAERRAVEVEETVYAAGGWPSPCAPRRSGRRTRRAPRSPHARC